MDGETSQRWQVELEAAEAAFARGRFEPVLEQLTPPLLAPDSGATPAQRLAAQMLRLRSLGKFDRFEAMLDAAHAALALAPPEPSRLRAELLALMSFAYNHGGLCEPALHAAQLALRDALALDETDLAALALERFAMAYLWMGDATGAERYMLEALGFQRQSEPRPRDLLRYSNALHLACTLYDARVTQDEAGAHAQLLRFARFTTEGDRLAAGEVPDYVRGQWRGNRLRWQRRRGQPASTEAPLRELLAQAIERGWLILALALRLELALLLETQQRPAEAAVLCEELLQAGGPELRRQLWLRTLITLLRLRRRLGEDAAADRVQAELEAAEARRQAEAARLRQRLAELDLQLIKLLAEADRARLSGEIRRLRERRDEGQALRLPGCDWLPA
ncbi:hypothetical protein G8A07_01745 [Roseateles sp. DAIF2]|uniref:hypothetical protein n=1 Tax=Roseateles sp. DAIF2 TaxID=2714952 RepID=UPI0018A27361|nr:hypothetical protein [Roseateles sp. DAIF2]QPF71777.1 hypothetical protein G8A07_01745 [Roseateles sp. DAIF2]